MSSYVSPQFKYMIFYMFICILHLLRVYYKLTMWPDPSWFDSSVGRELHQYCRSHGFEPFRPFSGVFRALISYLSLQFKYMIFYIFICIIHLLRVYYELVTLNNLSNMILLPMLWYQPGHKLTFYICKLWGNYCWYSYSKNTENTLLIQETHKIRVLYWQTICTWPSIN